MPLTRWGKKMERERGGGEEKWRDGVERVREKVRGRETDERS